MVGTVTPPPPDTASSQWREWRWVILVLLATVFLIPMRRYTLPSSLPIHLEPYRPIVALILGAWAISLLSLRVTLQRTSLHGPMIVFVGIVLASLAANPDRIVSETYKSLFLFLTFFAIYLFMVTVVHSRYDIEAVVSTIVAFGAVLAIFAITESRLGLTPFDDLERYVPVLHSLPVELQPPRAGRFRAYASSEHPIALGALLVMLAPFALYLGVAKKRWYWWAASALLVVGAMATVSRTAVVMLAVALILIAAARWSDAKRFWPLLLPLAALVHVMLPGTMGTLHSAFFPEGGLISEQQTYADSLSTAGRIADIAPSLEEWEQSPLFGNGFGTRIPTGPNANSRLLDNQWLGLLLDTGVLGVAAFAFLIGRFVQRQLRLARAHPGPNGYLPLACASAVAAYGVGMFMYDAFSFTQTTVIFFVILALGSSYERVFAREGALVPTLASRSRAFRAREPARSGS